MKSNTDVFFLSQGSADPLNSAFHLTYNMVLNLLRVEEINPEYMLEKSFYQFQHYRAIPGVVESKYKITTIESHLAWILNSKITAILAALAIFFFWQANLGPYVK